eukprot:5990654-Pleurochrysis_carterae.AAC.3
MGHPVMRGQPEAGTGDLLPSSQKGPDSLSTTGKPAFDLPRGTSSACSSEDGCLLDWDDRMSFGGSAFQPAQLVAVASDSNAPQLLRIGREWLSWARRRLGYD